MELSGGSLVLSTFVYICSLLRDWSLITGRGGLQNGKIAGPKLFAPPPSRQGKTFRAPLLKSGNFTRPPYNMAKTSSYRVKTTPKLFVTPPSEWLKLFPPPLFVGVKLHVPPLPFCSPPLPVISDQSLKGLQKLVWFPLPVRSVSGRSLALFGIIGV